MLIFGVLTADTDRFGQIAKCIWISVRTHTISHQSHIISGRQICHYRAFALLVFSLALISSARADQHHWSQTFMVVVKNMTDRIRHKPVFGRFI